MLRHLKLIPHRSLAICKPHKAVSSIQPKLDTYQLLNLTRKHFVTNALIGNLVHGSSFSFWRKIVDVINDAKRTIDNKEQQPRLRTPSEWLKIIRGEAPADYGRYSKADDAANPNKTPEELAEEYKFRKELRDFIDARVKTVNLLQAKRLVESDELEEATRCLDLILQYDPKNADAYAVKAFVAGKQFKNQEALTYLDKALELNPSHRTALLGKGTIYLQLKEYELALKYLDALLEKYPLHIPALVNKAAILARTGRDEQALRVYEDVLRLDPANDLAIECRTRLFSKRKRELELEQKKDLEQLKLRSTLKKERVPNQKV